MTNPLNSTPVSRGGGAAAHSTEELIFPLPSELLREANRILSSEIGESTSRCSRDLTPRDSHLIFEQIYLGDINACEKLFGEPVHEFSEKHIVISLHKPSTLAPSHIEHLCVEMTDGITGWNGPNGVKINLKRIFRLFEKSREEGIPLLIHCSAGRSRSAFVLIAYVMWSTGQPYENVIAFIRSKRFICHPSDELQNILRGEYSRMLSQLRPRY